MFNLKRLFFSFKCAIKGIYFALRFNQNIRIHLIIAFFVIIASIIFKVNAFEKGIIGIVILLVITTEMLNTAIEAMTNLIKIEHSKEAEIAKDVAAGMVLLSAVGSVIVGLLIFVPYILKFFNLG